jgi:signal transduction histidine kinase
VITSVIAFLAHRVVVAGDGGKAESLDLLMWIAAAAVADLMTVQIGRGVVLSMSVPVLLAAAMLHPPAIAAAIAFLGELDVREIRREISLERAAFNRAQIGMAVGASSAVMLSLGLTLEFPAILGVAAVGLVTDSAVNVACVAVSTWLSGQGSMRQIVTGLFGRATLESLTLYACLCLVAPLLCLIYISWGGIALLLFTLLVIPFRLTLVKTQELDELNVVARVRQAALERAQEAAEYERADERRLLAGDLHDDVLPCLYQVHLMGEVLKQDLAHGRLLDLDEDLPALLEATNIAQQAVRRHVRGLRLEQSRIRDVGTAIRSCVSEVEATEGCPRIELHLDDVSGTDRAQRTLVQVAREAIVNGARHSSSSVIRVELIARDGLAELSVVDDGVGFDPRAVDRSEHFGLQFMAERVNAVGGRLTVSSHLNGGVFISALIPLDDGA